jgi:hypothetical protein
MMQYQRRQFLQLTAGAAALPAVSRVAWAQAYPTRAVRIIVGFAAGGAYDIVARLMGQWLSERLGQPFVMDEQALADRVRVLPCDRTAHVLRPRGQANHRQRPPA